MPSPCDTIRQPFCCMLLDQHLRPSSTLASVVALTSKLLLDDATSAHVDKELETHAIHLPGVDLMRQSRLRLDLMSVLWEQKLWMRQEGHFYLLVDASPQMGMEIFACIEDCFHLPTVSSVQARIAAGANLNDRWTSQIDLLSTLGNGRAGLAKKALNVANGRRMKCNSESSFMARRQRYRCVTTDQGTERSIADTPLSVMPEFKDRFHASSPESFLLPKAVSQPGFSQLVRKMPGSLVAPGVGAPW